MKKEAVFSVILFGVCLLATGCSSKQDYDSQQPVIEIETTIQTETLYENRALALEYQAVVIEDTDLLAEPDSDDKVSSLKKNDTVTVKAEVYLNETPTDWYYVQSDSNEMGYLTASDLNFNISTEEDSATTNTDKSTEVQDNDGVEESTESESTIVADIEPETTEPVTTESESNEVPANDMKDSESTESVKNDTQQSVSEPQQTLQSTPDTSDVTQPQVQESIVPAPAPEETYQDSSASSGLTPEEQALLEALREECGEIIIEEKPIHDVSDGLGFDTSNVIMH